MGRSAYGGGAGAPIPWQPGHRVTSVYARLILPKRPAAIAGALGALAFTAPASADVASGAADDRGKYADDGGAAFFGTMRDVGMTENRVTVLWDPDNPTSIVETGF